ncbi:hypothetical protein KIH27_03460 [Mycobacterium sp. M1]|uniref:Uncharacterized protein n=1 Tax=Mycolicibacter acidiphilus TaxID=2835306 RepID=A0ABS5RGQ9_9MYCO|nr:hypothetical protein [Mycolicibacter acidiphilus]MBS9532641.1 hypothetical protein [Mycolicibacter acidiphilus]
MTTRELVYEAWRSGPAAEVPRGQPLRYPTGDGVAHAVAGGCWLRLSLVQTDGSAGGVTELGVATPIERHPDAADDAVDAVRVWPRGTTPDDDARTVLAWLRGNTLAERLGVDTDLLMHLFIEAAVNCGADECSCHGEYLATLAPTAQGAGTAATSRWSLSMRLPAASVAAVLDGIADGGPRWRYAIVAASDPESPAGRVRRRLLDDLYS